MRRQTFTLDDYLAQLSQIKSMGNLEQLVGMMPGVKPGALKDAKVDESVLARTEAIIHSMTKKEREKPEIINLSRKKRIAAGSGTSVEAVGRLLKQFETTNKMMKQLMNATKTKGFGKRKFGGFHF
jgi:signal recognition particle subunit SRP54